MAEGSGTRFVRRRMLTICAGMALLGVFGGFDDWMRARDDRAFDLRGKPAQSLPETHPSASTTAGDEVALSDVGPGDRVVNAKPIRLDATRYGAWRAGSRLDIVYLPDRPKVVRLSGWEPRLPIPLWAGPLVGLAGIFGFAMLSRGRR
jgi:hypothetical protein